MGKKIRKKRKLKKTEWTTINVAKGLAKRVEKVIYQLNYKSVSDYADDAIRRKLETDEYRIRREKTEKND